MAQDTTKADAVLKNFYLPVFRNMVNQKALLLFGYSPEDLSKGAGSANAAKGETYDYRGISRDLEKIQFAGRKWIFAAHTGRNESGTAYAEDGYLPTPSQQKYEDFEDRLRYFAKGIELTGVGMEVSERSVGAYLKLLEGETKGAINDLRWDINRQAFGDQTGNLTEITADGANTITVSSVQYLRVGMPIDLVNKTTDAVLATRNITAINPSTKVVTYDGADAAATPGTHVVALKGNWKKEINGLRNIIDSTTYPTLHNVNASTAGNEWWKGKISDGGNTTFDEDVAQMLLDDIGAEGEETELIVTTRGIRRRYVNTLKAQKRFNDSMAGKLHGGFKTIDFDGLPLAHDDVCPKKHAFFLIPEHFTQIWLGGNDFRWLDRDGRVLRMVTDGTGDKDNWRAYAYRYMDMGCFNRKVQGMMNNLADDEAKVMS